MNIENFVEKTKNFAENLDIKLVKNFVVFNEISSTNLKAKELAQKNAGEGTIVISKIQKKGRGRFTRTWESPSGGLYFSIILRPECEPDKTTLLPLIGALSVCKTVSSIIDLDVKIKWPNDVLIDGKKVCGILLESESGKDKLKFVILGIGINLNTDMSSLSEELHRFSTSISNEIGINLDYYDFLKKLLVNLVKYYTMFAEGKFEMIVNEWKNNSDTIGRKLIIDMSTEKINATAIDVDSSGFLIVKTEDGEVKKINSGDCTYFD